MLAAIARLSPVWPPSVGRIALGFSLREHLVEDLDGERLDVGRVGQLRVGHDRRRIRVDQDDAQALLAERLARLRARVVELAGLADHDRPGPDDEDRLEILPTWHRDDRLPQMRRRAGSAIHRSPDDRENPLALLDELAVDLEIGGEWTGQHRGDFIAAASRAGPWSSRAPRGPSCGFDLIPLRDG